MLSLLILEFVVEVNLVCLVCLASRDLFSRVEGVVCVARGLVDRLKSARFFGYRAGYRGLSRVIDLEICSFLWKRFVALFGFVAFFGELLRAFAVRRKVDVLHLITAPFEG